MVIDNIWDYATTEEIPMGFKITSLGDVAVHTHSFVEIFYVTNGSANHKFNGGPSKPIQAGDAYLILPSQTHSFIRTKETICSHRDIIIRESFFHEVCDFIDPTLFDKLSSGEISPHVTLSPAKVNYLENQINIINQILPTSIGQKKAIIKTFAAALLEPFLTFKAEMHFSEFPAWFKNLLSNFNMVEYMQQGLNKILKPFNYDRKYLCRVFKKYMGITMTDYLNHIRLDYAMNMIQSTNKNILDIAQDLGFSSVSYFNVIFKKRYGITPMEARQNSKK